MDIIGTIIIMLGVIFIYDARQITKERFSYSDQNSMTRTFKVVGFIMSIIGGLILLIV